MSSYKALLIARWSELTARESDIHPQPEQILIRPAQGKKKTPSSKAPHLVTIIPTGCVGTSALLRVLPTIIEFEMPDRRKDRGLGGTLSTRQEVSSRNETYLAAFTTACNEHLERIGKKVITLDDDSKDQWSCRAV